MKNQFTISKHKQPIKFMFNANKLHFLHVHCCLFFLSVMEECNFWLKTQLTTTKQENDFIRNSFFFLLLLFEFFVF